MKKVIEGRIYNTDTAREVCEVGSVTADRSDFGYWSGTLYRTAKGAWFVAGEGGAMSIFSRSSGTGGYAGGSGIVPVTVDEAREYAEQWLDADTMGEWFDLVDA